MSVVNVECREGVDAHALDHGNVVFVSGDCAGCRGTRCRSADRILLKAIVRVDVLVGGFLTLLVQDWGHTFR